MLKLKNLVINLEENNKEIVHGLSLEVLPGEVHLLNGNNGSGKSTLVNTIMGNPMFAVGSGQIQLVNESYDEYIMSSVDQELIDNNSINLVNMEPDVRSLLGIFLANQYPIEIPGVSLTSFLRLIYNSRFPKEQQLSVFKFKKYIEDRAALINYPKHLLLRNLNEGFSGGEKKKTEILQMLILEPRYVMLDEVDSGLDRNSVKEVFEGIAEFKKLFSNTAFIIITHYDKVQEYLKPDFTHEMSNGKIIQ